MIGIGKIVEAIEVNSEEELEVADLSEEDLEDEANSEEALKDLIEALVRCMMLPVINVEKNVKFHLNLQEISLFFAVIVLEKVKVQAEVLVQEAEVDPHLLECPQNN